MRHARSSALDRVDLHGSFGILTWNVPALTLSGVFGWNMRNTH
jgi:hypothetical protein